MNLTFRQTKLKNKSSYKSQSKSFFPHIEPLPSNSPNKIKINKNLLKQQQIILKNSQINQNQGCGNPENENGLIIAYPKSIKNIQCLKQQVPGLEMWALNNNLKQFSETRQMGFYKTEKKQKSIIVQSKQNGVMNKTKTHDIQSVNKIFRTNQILLKNRNVQTQKYKQKNKDKQRQRSESHLKKLYDPNNLNAKNKTIQTRNKSLYNQLYTIEKTIYGTMAARRLPINTNKERERNYQLVNKRGEKSFSEQKINIKQAINPYLKTFINGSHLKREQSNCHFQILEMNTKRQSSTSKNVKQLKNNKNDKQCKKVFSDLRKNRFEKYEANLNKEYNSSNKLSDSYTESNQQQNGIDKLSFTGEEEQDQLKETDGFLKKQQQNKTFLTMNDKNITDRKLEDKNKYYEFHKSIGLINKSLLASVDNYLQYDSFSTMPFSAIPLFVQSMVPPEIINSKENKKVQLHKIEQMDFFFSNFSFTPPEYIQKGQPIFNEKRHY